MKWQVTVEFTQCGTTELEVEADTKDAAEGTALADADNFNVDFDEVDRTVEGIECLTPLDENGEPIPEPIDVEARRLGYPMLSGMVI